MRARDTLTAVPAGIAGGVAANVAMLVTFRILGMGLSGDGILLDPAIQSDKLIRVWTEIEPLPRVVTQPVLMGAGIVILAIAHAAIYLWLSEHWPGGTVSRALRFGLLIFVMSYVFWEFFTPFNMFGEPVYLTLLQLVFWAIVAFSEAFALAAVAEWMRGQAPAAQ